MNKAKTPQMKLAFLIAIYLSVSVLFFSSALLIWTYHTTNEAIEREILNSFEQRHAIAQIIFEEQVDRVENLLKNLQANPMFSRQLWSENQAKAQLDLLKILNANDAYDLDLLFLSRLDGQVWLNGSSSFFNTETIVSEINKNEIDKSIFTGVRRFQSKEESLTTVMLEIPLLNRDTGMVYGSLLGGYVLNDNFSIMESIRSQTQASSVALFDNGNWLGSTEIADSLAAQILINARNSVKAGYIYAFKGFLTTYKVMAVAGNQTSLEIALSIPDEKSSLTKRSFIQKSVVTLIFSFLFLLLSIVIINQITQPSLKKLLSYTKELSGGNLSVTYQNGYISEFNQVGQAMEKMAVNLSLASRKKNELEHIINLSPVVAFLWKAEDQWPVEFVSENVRQFGYTPKDFIQKKKKYADIIHPDDLEKIIIDIDQYSKTPSNERINEFIKEYRIFTKNGEERWVEDRTWTRCDTDGLLTHYHGVILDITKRKQADADRLQLENRLSRAKKMEALGLLAGGVAHDLNNILSGIVGYPDLIMMGLPPESQLRPPINRIKESGERAAAVVQDLLTIARGVASHRQIMNLNNLIKNYLDSPEYKKLTSLFPGITVETRLSQKPLYINCSAIHITKVMMNLTSNAMEALGDKGSIIISTGQKPAETLPHAAKEMMTGDCALITVRDNGPGIPPEDIERIFEPFYTKKKMGRSGTGLGLTVVWNTIKDHDGHVRIKSDENHTAFELFLPIAEGEEIALHKQLSIEEVKGNGETVLVVDDESSLREIASGMLSRLGYATRTASSGEEAIEYLNDHQVDILLLDMMMPPGINGLETYKRIIVQHPGQKAVIVSGFSETEKIREVIRLGVGKYLKKPYTMETLGMAMKETLEK